MKNPKNTNGFVTVESDVIQLQEKKKIYSEIAVMRARDCQR